MDERKRGTHAARITTDYVMACVVKTPWVRVVLQGRLAQVPVVEAVDVRVVQDQGQGVVGSSAQCRVLVDIAAKATRVGAQPVGLGILGNVVDDGGFRPETDDHAANIGQYHP